MPLKKSPKKRLPSSDGPNPRSKKIPRQDQDGAGPKDLSLSACPTPATSLKMPSANKTAPASPAKGGAALMKFKLPTGGASEKPGALDLTDGETALHTVKNGAKDRNSHVLTSSANAKKPQQYLITNLTVTAETDLDSVDTWGRLAKVKFYDGHHDDIESSTLVTKVVGKMLCDVHSMSKKNALDEFYGDAMKPCAAPGASIEMRPSRVGVAMYERAADGTNQIKQGLSKVLAAGSLFDASVSFMYWEMSDENKKMHGVAITLHRVSVHGSDIGYTPSYQ